MMQYDPVRYVPQGQAAQRGQAIQHIFGGAAGVTRNVGAGIQMVQNKRQNEASKAEADAFLGSLRTKVFAGQGDTIDNIRKQLNSIDATQDPEAYVAKIKEITKPLGEEAKKLGIQDKVTSFIGEMQQVGVPAGAPAPEAQQAQAEGRMAEGQQPLPTPPSQFYSARRAEEESILDPTLAEDKRVQSQIGLMKEDEKVRAAEEEKRRVAEETQRQEDEKVRAAEEEKRRVAEETQRQAGLVSDARTQEESYGQLAGAGVEPVPVIKSLIGARPKTSQERDEQSKKLDKLDQDLRGAGSGTSDDILKGNTIAERRHTILDKHKKLLVTLKKAALYADANNTESLNKMFALDPEKNISELESVGYDGSADPSEIQLAYENAVKQTPTYEKRVKEAEETVKILEKRGGSALASAGREATETVERESRDELFRELEMLKTTLSPSLFYHPDVFYDVASKVASPETVKYIKEKVQGGKRIEEILSTPQTTQTGAPSAGGGGQYPNATNYIVTEYQRLYNRRPSQEYIDSKLQALKAQGVELD